MRRRDRVDPQSSSRPGEARVRLMDALSTLTERAPRQSRLTVAELCRLANVSRNSLYRYHAPILAALRRRQAPKSARTQALRSVERLRSETALLHERLTKLATLADHYFLAYREALALLERRDRELASLRRHLTMQPATLPGVHTR